MDGDGQTNDRVCVCVYLAALWQVPGCMSPGPWADHSAAVGEEASTRTASLASQAVVVGLSRSEMRHCGCGSGLSVGDLRNPTLFPLPLLRAGKWAFRGQPGLPGLQVPAEAEKVPVPSRDEWTSEGLGGALPSDALI